MSYMDNCTACEEKNITLDFQQNQLDSIRKLIEDDDKKTHGKLIPITVLYHSLSELRDKIYDVLES